MAELSEEVPLPPTGLSVGLLFNTKGEKRGETQDADAEYDSLDTVHAIRDAFLAEGFQVVLMEADETLPESLKKARVDIAFNIAEGMRGRGRECEVPALLNLLNIPFTGSDETALCLALDKALCKRLLSTYHIRTPKYCLIRQADDLRAAKLRYPAIVKPNAEGSSKGIHDACVVSGPEALRALVEENLRLYNEPMLVEEYIEGREFTVGILGNGREARAFLPMEIVFRNRPAAGWKVYSFSVKQDYKNYIDYVCPAELDEKTQRRMQRCALRAFAALDCQDFARVDFRLADDGALYFIEINPLPGLAPGYSDYPMLAAFQGLEYGELVCSVLRAALRRHGLEVAK